MLAVTLFRYYYSLGDYKKDQEQVIKVSRDGSAKVVDKNDQQGVSLHSRNHVTRK